MRWPASIVLALILSSAGVVRASEPAPSEPAAPSPAEVIDIEIDVADLPESRANIASVVEPELQRLLSEQPELPEGVVLADDRRLLIELRPGPIPGADDVLIRIEAQLEGRLLAESLTESCLSCSDEQVAQKALSMLRPLLGEFPAVERRPAEAPSRPSTSTDADAGGDSRARPRDALLISGATALAVGIVGLGIGIPLVVVDERTLSEPGAPKVKMIEYRNPGIAVTTAGGALAITGAALLGVALARRGRGNIAAAPMLAPDMQGIGVVGRF